MNVVSKTGIILIAEDDENDRFLINDAIKEVTDDLNIEFSQDGNELIEFLEEKGSYFKSMPNLILLDLNMTKMDGRDALKIIKTDPRYKRIPIIVFTTSILKDDIFECYDLGINSVIIKPNSFTSLVDIISIIIQYWFKTVQINIE